MAEQTLEQIRKIRLEKVAKLRDLGIDPYPARVDGKPRSISEALSHFAKASRDDHFVVEAAGRIMRWREHGNVTFGDLKDETGQIQIWFQKNNLKEAYKILRYFDIGDFLYVKGKVVKTTAGEISIDVERFQILTKSIRPLPSTWHGLKDMEERYRQRYVDLTVNNDVRKVFDTRSKIVTLLRKYLNDNGFTEVKTPSLQPLYGGATAKPFITHHNSLDSDMYLRIADELYLKRLVVGGFHKVYEIGTDFRNEGIDRWHNPEFQMLEFYWAYANYEDLMILSEEMLSEIAKEVTGSTTITYGDVKVNFKTPWKRITYRQALLEKTHIDIDKVKDFSDLKKQIKENNLKVDLGDASDLPTGFDNLYKALVRPSLIDPIFLIDYPESMRPLAKRKSDDQSKVENIQLVIAGAEIFNAYTELNDPIDQRARWVSDMERGEGGAEEYQMLDEDYIRALEYGMPPTAGWGMGIDRFTALLTNQHAIKDVILFPTLKPEDKKTEGKESYDYRAKRIIAIISEDLPKGLAANVLGHMAFSAGHYSDDSWMGRKSHIDADGSIHVGISKYPFIVLGANKEKIKTIVEEAKDLANVLVVDYPQEMFDTGHDDELSKSLIKATENKLTYHAVLLVGESNILKNLAQGLELYK